MPSEGIPQAQQSPPTLTIGERADIWRIEHNYATSASFMGFKLTEEIGEFARAVIGDLESRDGRGDAVQEAAQVTILLAAILERHYDTDLLSAVLDELDRCGA